MEELDVRLRNPFQDLLVTELIEDPERYSKMFSSQMLVGETLAVFRASNAVLTGPQGSGKSMVLNLVRYRVMSQYEKPPHPIEMIPPWLGISVNLTRIGFHAFGQRSASRAMTSEGTFNPELETVCACDYLSHYLFREFVNALGFVDSKPRFRTWLGIESPLDEQAVSSQMSSWTCWSGYYRDCKTFSEITSRCEERLQIWRSFLNSNFDTIPACVWRTKSDIGECMHLMGNLATSLTGHGRSLPLFVVIDQYEELTHLNPTHGLYLQRAINTLLKARDPKVFYKIGVRTHDWGNELRVLGGDSRIEEQRDYVRVDLADVLMRKEDPSGWVFKKLAWDVAERRMQEAGYRDIGAMAQVLGRYEPESEARLYFRTEQRIPNLLKPLPEMMREAVLKICGDPPSTLELRLAVAWVLQRLRRKVPPQDVLSELGHRPWTRPWWRKERILVALLQLASLDNQRKYYFGWRTVLYLCGGNVSAFLLICSSIWDEAAKMGKRPNGSEPLPPAVQTRGVYSASDIWSSRDQNTQPGGGVRHEFLRRFGEAVRKTTVQNVTLSNPGHSGFSVDESELNGSPGGEEVRRFLDQCVNWAMLEERSHTSKNKGDSRRRKWYLHPLLSPVYGIPHVRVKEPYYATVDEVHRWLTSPAEPITLRTGAWSKKVEPVAGSLQLPLPWR